MQPIQSKNVAVGGQVDLIHIHPLNVAYGLVNQVLFLMSLTSKHAAEDTHQLVDGFCLFGELRFCSSRLVFTVNVILNQAALNAK